MGPVVWMLLVIACVFAQSPPVLAADTLKIDEVVVTATRSAEKIERISSSVTVITSEEIERSTATTVPELLGEVTGVLVRDLYGNGTKSTIDMRGFARGLNTVVMLDGRRLNEIDLSGVDWNLIPLENIERIEVVRGSGSVLYGDSAMTGVINIITKKGTSEGPEIKLGGRLESYDGHAEHLSVGGTTDSFGYFFFGKFRETDGYRENSEFRARDLSGRLNFNLSDKVYADVRGGYHKDHQGYPGGLTLDQIREDRRQSLTPDDGVDYDQYYVDIALGYLPGDWGELELVYTFNSREFDSDFILWGGNIVRDTDTDEVKLKQTFRFGSNSLVAGIDRIHSEVDNSSTFSGFTTISDVEKTELGYYVQNDYSYGEEFVFTLGYRYSDTEFKDTVSGASSGSGEMSFNESAVKGGVTYNYAEGAKGFLSYTKGYRLPTTDEIFSFDGTIVKLNPELANTYEVGVVHPFGEGLEASLTLYDMRVKDELYYNPVTYANENLDRTRHRGAELGYSAKVSEGLSINAGWTYTRAKFASGENNGKKIPLVPENTLNLGAAFSLDNNASLSVLLNWVGERVLDNDLGNTEDRLDDYMTVDVRLSCKEGLGEFFVGVDNVFDEEYENYGVVGSTDNKYYPAPERKFYAGVSMTF